MLSYVPNHSKQLKPTKVIKLQWIASIWCQKHQTTQNYKSDQITMKCMDLTSKRTKMLSYVANHSKQRKSTKVIKVQWIASIWCQNDQTMQSYKSPKFDETFDVKTTKMLIKLPMNSSTWTYKTIKNVELRPKPFKQRKTTKVIKLRWIASIWRQNEQKCWVTSQTIQNNANLQKLSKYNELHRFDVKTTKMLSYVPNNAKLQKWSNYDEVHRFDVKTNKNVELRPKPFKTTQTYKSNQITMNWIDLMSKTSNNAKLQKWSNYDEVHGFDVKTNKNVELRPKPFKTTQIYKSYQITNCIDLMSKRCWVTSKTIQTTQNYKSDQITMNCMDLTSKRTKMLSYVPNHSKQRKSTKVIKVQWIASIWCQNDMLSYVPNHSKHSKTTKVIKLRWIASIWRQNDQKCWVTSQTIQNNSNLQK